MLTTTADLALRQGIALCRVTDDPGVLQHLRQRQALARHLGQQLRAMQGRFMSVLALGLKVHDNEASMLLSTPEGPSLTCTLPPQTLAASCHEAALAKHT